ncbi:MAG: tyrosine-type recombinase/integrase, partial [Chloroflexi bacterium]|nr:tyrosine-type recombinase/integrase [Chloroflexota bacterium]
TYSQYEFIIRLHILPVIGQLQLNNVVEEHIEKVIATSRRGGHSPTTSRHVYKLMRLLFERAVARKMIPRSPAADIDAPRAARRDVVMLSPQQVTEFCHAVEGTRFEPVFLLALSTGARVSELLALRWESVDWNTRLLTISHSLRLVKGGAKLDEPKTHGSVRRVALPPQVIASLKRHRAGQAEQALKMGRIYSNPLDLIFTMEMGGRVDRRNLLRNHFRPLLRKAGLPTTLVMHDLRHQFTTTALANGLPVTLVAQALGHNSPVTLLRTYAHVLPTTQYQVANVFADVLPDSGFDSNAAG